MDNDPHKDRREAERQEARVKIRFATPEALEKEYTSNISKGGLFVNTRKTYPLRSKVKFIMVFPISDEVVELTGEVVHVQEPRPDVDPSQSGIGVQFIDLTPQKRATIENYIARIDKRGQADEPELAEFGEGEKEEPAPTPQPQKKTEFLKDAIRRAAKEMGELSPTELVELKRKIKLFYAKRANRNHYDLLGISYTASPESIRNAYHKLSLNFHPDRHHKRLPPDLRPQIEDIFGKINRAYKTLRDFDSRVEYDVSVGNWGSVPNIPELSEEAKRLYQTRNIFAKQFPEKIERADEILNEAEKALEIGDKHEAVIKLKLAHSFDPFNEKARKLLEENGVKVKPLAEIEF